MAKALAGAVRVIVSAKGSTDAATVQSADLGTMTLVSGSITNAGDVALHARDNRN